MHGWASCRVFMNHILFAEKCVLNLFSIGYFEWQGALLRGSGSESGRGGAQKERYKRLV